MTSRALAWRTVTANPARALLAVAGIAVIGALLFDMLLLSRGLLLSFSALINASDFDVRVSATDGLPGLRPPLADVDGLLTAIARLPQVKEVAAIRSLYADAIAGGHADQGTAVIAITPGAERQTWRLVAGANLSAPDPAGTGLPPVVVSEWLAKTLGLKPGDTVRLRAVTRGTASALPASPFLVTGVGSFLFRSADEPLAAIRMTDTSRIETGTAHATADLLVAASRAPFGPDDAATAIRKLRPDLHANSNAEVIAQFNQNGFAYFRQVSLVLSSITLAFAFLLTATLLTVSVNQRLSEMAALRALGFPRSRIVVTLLWESAFLVGAGGVASVPIGAILAAILDRILLGIPGLPADVHFFVFEPRAMAWQAGLLTVTGLAAAAYPVWIAMRLPIADTLRREAV